MPARRKITEVIEDPVEAPPLPPAPIAETVEVKLKPVEPPTKRLNRWLRMRERYDSHIRTLTPLVNEMNELREGIQSDLGISLPVMFSNLAAASQPALPQTVQAPNDNAATAPEIDFSEVMRQAGGRPTPALRVVSASVTDVDAVAEQAYGVHIPSPKIIKNAPRVVDPVAAELSRDISTDGLNGGLGNQYSAGAIAAQFKGI